MDNGAGSYRRFLDGDDNGIAEIVTAYKDGLILYLNGYVKNISVAEDLAEDTFFRLMIRKPKFWGRSSFRSWLYAIGRNVAVDHIRRHTKQIAVSDQDIERYAVEECSLEHAYIRQEQKIQLHHAMKELSIEYQTVLWLVFFEGFSTREVAVVMRKSVRQITDLLYRAKLSLKNKLTKEGFVYEGL